MRKFRFVGEPNNYSSPYVEGKIYDSDFKFNKDYDHVGKSASLFEADWEEVFEDELTVLHKDTDLGYFAGLTIKTAKEYFVEQAYELPADESCFAGVGGGWEDKLWCDSEVVAFAEAYYRYKVNSLPLGGCEDSVGVDLDKNDE